MGNDRSPVSHHNVWRDYIFIMQRQVTLNLKLRLGLNSNTRYYAGSAYLQVLNDLNKNPENLGKLYFRHSMAANSIVSGRLRSKFKLIQAFMVVFVTCKNDEDPSKK